MKTEPGVGRCPVCLRSVGITARGLVVRHDSWRGKGMSMKSGRYSARCDGSFQPSTRAAIAKAEGR